mgnify:CR=1 FL=1
MTRHVLVLTQGVPPRDTHCKLCATCHHCGCTLFRGGGHPVPHAPSQWQSLTTNPTLHVARLYFGRFGIPPPPPTHTHTITVLYCTVLYCTVLYCTVLYCISCSHFCDGHHSVDTYLRLLCAQSECIFDVLLLLLVLLLLPVHRPMKEGDGCH